MKNSSVSHLQICELQSKLHEISSAKLHLERSRADDLRKIEKLTAERDNALAQNAELAAQIEAIRAAWKAAYTWPDTVEEKQAIWDAIAATPTQHLRYIQAEAGRAGFVAGVQYAHKRPDTILPKVIEMVACDYAERVKAGEA